MCTTFTDAPTSDFTQTGGRVSGGFAKEKARIKRDFGGSDRNENDF
jgi:hypothetical protein